MTNISCLCPFKQTWRFPTFSGTRRRCLARWPSPRCPHLSSSSTTSSPPPTSAPSAWLWTCLAAPRPPPPRGRTSSGRRSGGTSPPSSPPPPPSPPSPPAQVRRALLWAVYAYVAASQIVSKCFKQSCGSGMFISDPGSDYFPSWIRIFPSRIPDPHQRI